MKIVAMTAACLVAASGLALAPPAAAQTKKTTPKRAKPAAKKQSLGADFSMGGIVGCSNGPMTGRAARVAAELGGNQNCGPASSPPTPRAPAITATGLVGTWGLGGCQSPEFYKRIRANGRFTTADEQGSWALQTGEALPVLKLSFRRDGDAPDRGLRVQELALTPDGPDRMRLNVGWWVRCSRNPDAPLH
ncbi:hypothetical protein P6144_01010 [Sphingomonas sp. HITSZ_GF]|uniref:hypothetical protein n=1 Tax=Sphingomonas sp. HITSZ_GF TaxID=3037247 RepID=UPI00240D4CB6|nr:hypothetical protein [Sphingomonas sp. HITSZ_GF]MDG2532213.1 hypothetical protein [Sphingomonas sp. HITSZ_GF]